MFYVYIIQSEKTGRFYVGYTGNIAERIQKHNFGSTTSTRSGIPWKLVYYEEHAEKRNAIIREKEIKNKKSRKYIEKLIEGFENKKPY